MRKLDLHRNLFFLLTFSHLLSNTVKFLTTILFMINLTEMLIYLPFSICEFCIIFLMSVMYFDWLIIISWCVIAEYVCHFATNMKIEIQQFTIFSITLSNQLIHGYIAWCRLTSVNNFVASVNLWCIFIKILQIYSANRITTFVCWALHVQSQGWKYLWSKCAMPTSGGSNQSSRGWYWS